jgi:hypothetical protein
MSSEAVTKAACDSKDMDRALASIVDAHKGMQWLVIERDTKRIVGAAYSLNEARALMPRNSCVKNVHTGCIVAIAA